MFSSQAAVSVNKEASDIAKVTEIPVRAVMVRALRGVMGKDGMVAFRRLRPESCRVACSIEHSPDGVRHLRTERGQIARYADQTCHTGRRVIDSFLPLYMV